MRAPDLPHSASFSFAELASHLTRFAPPSAWTSAKRWYELHDDDGALRAALRPPLVVAGVGSLPSPQDAVASAREPLGRYGILLFQAGAASLGLFDGLDMLDHKAIKRYVVRGKGRAQPTHLKTRGKSRMGSRMRLRNAERLLGEVSARLRRWWGDDEPPRTLYLSCPVRLFADLCRSEPPPPVTPDDPRCVRIPIDVRVPNHAELLRVQRSITRGRIWSSAPLDSDEAG